MTQVNIYEAKTQLSRLVARVAEGEEIVIARAGKPVARIVPYNKHPVRRQPGGLKGLLELSEDWDSPETNAEIVTMFESSQLVPDTES
jgi:prevent-host-death family protein